MKLAVIIALLIASPAHAGQSRDAAIATLVEHSRAAHSDALLVMRDGEVLVDERTPEGDPVIEMMSATKGVVALGVMKAIADGAISGLDEPVHHWFPEWREGPKRAITLRMLMNHTSGLRALANTSDIYPAPDFVQLALAAELDSPPGERFFYNNKATNLLAGIIERATGSKLDDYMRVALFDPMGVTGQRWTRDSAGNPHGMAGLQLRAADAAKLGQLVLDRGRWGTTRLIPTILIDTMLAPGSPHNRDTGLMWVRTPAFARYTLEPRGIEKLLGLGMAEDVVARLEPMIGQRFDSRNALRDALRERLGDALPRWSEAMRRTGNTPTTIFTVESGPVAAFHAEGYLGQYIVVIPHARIVAVRQYRARDAAPPADSFGSLVEDLIALADAVSPTAAPRPPE